MTTAVAILNWNGIEYLKKFLPEVVKFSSNQAEIWLIDNASSDDSVEWVMQNFPEVKMVINTSNGGYAKGYNDGLKQINTDTYILLNSDIEVTKGWLDSILLLMQNKHFVAVQPKILSYQNRQLFEYAGAAGGFIDRDGFMFCRGRMFNTFETDNGQYNDSSEIFWASGACLAINSEAFWEVGGLDEDFFAHMEEIDLCWRLKNLGYKIGYCGSSTVHHVGGGTLSKINPQKTYLNFRNNLFLLLKNYRQSPIFRKIFFRLILDGIAAFKFLFEGSFRHFFAVFKAHMSFYRQFFKFLNKRNLLKTNPENRNVNGFYNKSVVWAYFVQKKTTFTELEKSNFI